MPSISSIETVIPRTQSLSPSSLADTNFTHGRTWLDNEPGGSISPQQKKGKERQIEHEYNKPESDESFYAAESAAYPPTNADEAETRYVEEYLRRWEVAERQKRKMARDSVSTTQTYPSLVGNLSHRAKLLWPGRRFRHTDNKSFGTHFQLQSQENLDAPVEDINASPTSSSFTTPISPYEAPKREHHSDDPFANPPKDLSPFADSRHQEVSRADSQSPGIRVEQPPPSPTFSRVPPTPKPLGLPPPRTPPPPIHLPPPPTVPLVGTQVGVSSLEDHNEPRWWHDWLCGCNEGPDRGGDYQAGRTNPFE